VRKIEDKLPIDVFVRFFNKVSSASMGNSMIELSSINRIRF
jgi:hypothetical protein